MRAAAVGCFSCFTAVTSLAFATPEVDPTQTYHLHGYYKLVDDGATTWQLSDNSPWLVDWKATWGDPRLVKWGYAPVTHDSQRYYCLIDGRPRTGTHIARETFICGDPAIVALVELRPALRLYGGGP